MASPLYPWQAADWQRLQTLRQRPPQALLLRGSAGIGKLLLATEFARSLLCRAPQADGLACGQCPSCRWFAQGTHPDFRLLQPESETEGEDSAEGDDGKRKKKASKQIKVEQIRELAQFCSLSAHQGGRRVVLIQPAESMNPNAANALLKMLEEPPADLLFILVSHQYQQLLPTILSRCLSFPLALPEAGLAARRHPRGDGEAPRHGASASALLAGRGSPARHGRAGRVAAGGFFLHEATARRRALTLAAISRQRKRF